MNKIWDLIRNLLNSKPDSSWFAWIVVIILIPTIGELYNILHKSNPPQFVIVDCFLNPYSEIIIRANNYKANRKNNLDIIFDDFIFPQKGILSSIDTDGFQKWFFKLSEQSNISKYKNILHEGKHTIQVGFPGEKLSKKFTIAFISTIPVVKVHKEQYTEGSKRKTILKGKAFTKFSENQLNVEIIYYHEGATTEKLTVPLNIVNISEDDQFYCEFETPLKQFPVILPEDPRFNRIFFEFRVIDKANNIFYYRETYGQYVASGSKEFGAGSTNIEVNRKLNKIEQSSISKFKVQQKLYPFQSENIIQPIAITVTTRLVNSKDARYIEWKNNERDSYKPLALVFRDNVQIASTVLNSYTDTDELTNDEVKYAVELENISGMKVRSSSVLYTKHKINKPRIHHKVNNNEKNKNVSINMNPTGYDELINKITVKLSCNKNQAILFLDYVGNVIDNFQNKTSLIASAEASKHKKKITIDSIIDKYFMSANSKSYLYSEKNSKVHWQTIQDYLTKISNNYSGKYSKMELYFFPNYLGMGSIESYQTKEYGQTFEFAVSMWMIVKGYNNLKIVNESAILLDLDFIFFKDIHDKYWLLKIKSIIEKELRPLKKFYEKYAN